MIELRLGGFTDEQKHVLAYALRSAMLAIESDIGCAETCDECPNKRVCDALYNAVQYLDKKGTTKKDG